jgi:hypothetical protein
MGEHRFKVGQIVHFRPSASGVNTAPNQRFQITRQLPPVDGQFQYRSARPVKATYGRRRD